MTDQQLFAEPFVLHRDDDETGVSGTGLIADGVAFPDGTAVIHWRGPLNSTTVFDSVEMVEKIHGHNGKTRVVWVRELKPVSVDEAIGLTRTARIGEPIDLTHTGARGGVR